MKPLYIFLLLYATFITGLADGISMALSPIPGIGIVLAFTIAFCINTTMGAGLIMLLILNGVFHPKWGPAGIVGGFIPGLNFLPFWIGIVSAGIAYDVKKEGGAVGAVAALATAVASPTISNISNAARPLQDIRPAQRHEQVA